MKTREMCFAALMAALICIAAPLSVPIGPIPITLATFTVYLAGGLLGMKYGTLSVALYLLLGLVGLPVFSGWRSGLPVLAGATGGYLVGYLPCAWATGFGVTRWPNAKWAAPASMVVGTFFCYLIGTAWFMAVSGMNVAGALGVCVVPFLPGDAVKIVAASVVTWLVRPRLFPNR